MTPYYQDELTTIYCGDSSKIIPKVAMHDLLLTDPPYGLNNSWKRSFHGGNGATKLWGTIPDWDKEKVDGDIIYRALKKVNYAIIWGGNFYSLPPSRCWLVWDKCQKNRGADCEMAWTNLDISPKVFRMSRIDAYKNQTWFEKSHGAEKPVQLGLWCIDLVRPKSVLDGFMGSGNFILASRFRKIPAVGIELEEKYCKLAVNRINSGKLEDKKGLGLV